jgi:hypothetical protein
MKRLAYFVLGLTLGTALAWSGLIAWASVNLGPTDSLFDRSRDAQNLFLLLWFGASTFLGLLGVWRARK